MSTNILQSNSHSAATKPSTTEKSAATISLGKSARIANTAEDCTGRIVGISTTREASEWFKKQRELQSRLLGNEAMRQCSEDMGIAIMGAGKDRLVGGQYHVAIGRGAILGTHRRHNDRQHVWVLDTGATGHLITRKDVFVPGTYTEISGFTSTGIGGCSVLPVGQGTIRLQCATIDGHRWLEIPNVQYAPNAGVNLLSFNDMWPFIDTIEKLPMGLAFTQGNYRFTASIKDNLLLLDTTDALRFVGTAYSVKTPDRLWHKRMGHLAEGSLEQLRKVADGMDDVDPDGAHLCNDCVRGRM